MYMHTYVRIRIRARTIGALVVLVILTFYYPSVNQLFLFQSFSHPLYSEIVIDAGPFVREFAQLAMDEDIGTASREKAVLIGERRVGRKTIKILSQNVATFWGEHNLLGFLFEDKPIKLDSRFGQSKGKGLKSKRNLLLRIKY